MKEYSPDKERILNNASYKKMPEKTLNAPFSDKISCIAVSRATSQN